MCEVLVETSLQMLWCERKKTGKTSVLSWGRGMFETLMQWCMRKGRCCSEGWIDFWRKEENL